jgi:hypothetical protein
VSNLQLHIGQFATAGQPALTFLDARLIWLQAFLLENSLECIAPGTRAEVVLDVLPGRVLPVRVESVVWRRRRRCGSHDRAAKDAAGYRPAGGLPVQRFPVHQFETIDPTLRSRAADSPDLVQAAFY